MAGQPRRGWDDDTLLAVAQVMALKAAMAAGLAVGDGLSDAKAGLTACWSGFNPQGTAGPPRFPWLDRGEALPQGEADGLAAALAGMIFTGSRAGDPGIATLATTLATSARRPEDWPPLSGWFATLGLFHAGVPGETWRRLYQDHLKRTKLFVDSPRPGSWESAAGGDALAEDACRILALAIYYAYKL